MFTFIWMYRHYAIYSRLKSVSYKETYKKRESKETLNKASKPLVVRQ